MELSKQSIESVHVFVTSLGNYFMIEIAHVFDEGFRANGVNSKVLIDKIPALTPAPNLIQIVVAPHEFFSLFLEPRLTEGEVQEIVKAVYMLNTEQPFTPWFELSCKRAKQSKGVLDLTEQTTIECRRRGIFTIHAPLGYASCFESPPAPEDSSDQSPHQPFDLLFLGSTSPRRESFISHNAALFNRYNSNIVITRIEKPRFSDTAGFFANHERNRLLRSCKILVNIHANDNTYFEWLRVIMAIANRCLVISETSDYIEPLVNGQHVIVTELDKIADQCEYYLEHESERIKIVNQAYELITQKFNTGILCQSILEQVEQRIERPIEIQVKHFVEHQRA
jgi:hypothetical protein